MRNIHSPLDKSYNKAIKRLADIIISCLLIALLLSWIYPVVAIISMITMPGPVMFRQKRTGKDGCTFWIYKFRTMNYNAEADLIQASDNDPRCTKWGLILRKTCIDELPQLLNILLGDMSMVGPRPHILYQTEQYGKLIPNYMDRLHIKPGLTGWAQTTGFRGETPELWMMQERINRDIWYIEHWSLLLDLKIIYNEFALFFHGYKKKSS